MTTHRISVKLNEVFEGMRYYEGTLELQPLYILGLPDLSIV